MSRPARLGTLLLLALATLAVFAPVTRFGFASLDDPAYVSGNRHVREGLTREGLAWAFTTTEQSNWHPVTWLSLMIDAEIFGVNPGALHRTNLVLHVVNTLLLFLGLLKVTRRPGGSALVAALFALHPLHVESVVWITERKDLASTLFFFLALGAYVRYSARPGRARLLLVAVPFAISLMAKPMFVSLPLLLLVLDFWPLDRWEQGWARLVREKIPLLALSLASSIVTIAAQGAGGALRPFERYSLLVRVQNALVSYVTYLWKTIWPSSLSVYYPHPQDSLPLPLVAGAALLLAILTVTTVRLARRRPYLVAGWVWYLAGLVPVIGIVQVGGQALADRYTYVPLIGIFVAAAWGIGDLAGAFIPGQRSRRAVLATGACLALALLASRARGQVLLWKSNVRLFEHALAVTRANAFAHNCLANALFREQRLGDAVVHYREAIRISPSYADARGNLGAALLNQGLADEAEQQCREALRLDPAHVRSHVNLALVLIRRSRLREAAARLEEALRLEPELADAHRYLGAILVQEGRFEEAIAELGSATRIDPKDEESRRLLHEIEADPRRR